MGTAAIGNTRDASATLRGRWLQRRYAIPGEHGAWMWLAGPLVAGVAAAGSATGAQGLLAIAALAGFLLRQPLTVLSQALEGRRRKTDIAPAVLWMLIYGVAASAAGVGLLFLGHVWIFVLAAAAGVQLIVQEGAVRRKAVRGNTWLQAAGAAVLGLCAPGAYWAGGGGDMRAAAGLWILVTVYAVITIVHVQHRLRWRQWTASTAPAWRWSKEAGVPGLCGVGMCCAVALVLLHSAPALAPAAFIAPLADAIESALCPPVGARPKQIGMRQLASSSAFFLALSLAYVL